MIEFNYLKPFKFFCQKVLPLVYDDSLSYYEVLCKMRDKLNEVIEDVNNIPQLIVELIDTGELKEIIDELFLQLRANIAIINEHDSDTVTADRKAGELFWWHDDLYEFTRDMLNGERIVVNENCIKVTIEDEINKAIALSEDTYDYAKENIDEINEDIGEIIESINNIIETISHSAGVIKFYGSFSEMIADESLSKNDYCKTLGYYSKGDGGSANYTIVDAESDRTFPLDNGLYAEIHINGVISVKAFGAKGDDVTDDTDAIKSAIKCVGGEYNLTLPRVDAYVPVHTVFFPSGKYVISEELVIHKNNVHFVGEGVINTVIKCSTNAIIESIFTFTGSYGCGIKDMQLNGSIPNRSTMFNNPVSYGACSGLWLDQVAYCIFENVMIANMRNQGMRWCHVWQSKFENIMIYYVSGYGITDVDSKYYGCAIHHSIAYQLDTTFNPSESIKVCESNQITVNRLEVSGLMGGTFGCTNSLYNSTVQNVIFNDVIEENETFNGMSESMMPPCFQIPAWDIQGANYFVNPPLPETYVTINNHYVYYHDYPFNLPKIIYNIHSDHVRVSNAIVIAVKVDGMYSPYTDICYCATASSTPFVQIHVVEENLSSDQTKNFDSIVNCQNLYGINCMCIGEVEYTRHYTTLTDINVSDIITNYTLFVGVVALNNTTGSKVFSCTGLSPS